MIFKPHNYQNFGVQHMVENEACGLFLDMGLGKTVTVLTGLDKLMNDMFVINSGEILIIAPKRVAEDTWPNEIAKWEHTRHFTYSLVLGSTKERLAGLKKKADMYIINREQVAWLVAYYGNSWPFKVVVIDELSSFKNPSAGRFKALKSVRPLVDRVIGMTGSPTPKSLLDLWAQVYLLDRGQRLGNTISVYKDMYFRPDKRDAHRVFSYKVKEHIDSDILGENYYEKEIFDRIKDICISMNAKDWLDLPPRINRTVEIHLSPEERKKYLQFEKEQVLAMEETEINAVNAAALTGKLVQFANGAVYDDKRDYHVVHTKKLEALDEIVEDANGHPVLVFYQFKHDLERLQQWFKKYKPVVLKGPDDIKKWNAGEIDLMFVHPASAGHGLNLQAGGNIIVWFSLPWSLELYEQGNARLDRQGQTRSVIVHHLMVAETVDLDIAAALESKGLMQKRLMDAIKAKILKYRK